MNILVVNPFQSFGINKFVHRRFPVADVTGPYLKSLIPAGHAVTIADEARAKIDFDAPADLVMISALTVNAKRAYSIAREFRQRGSKVIIGGPHASALPDDAKPHCDAVAVGNAETMMDQIIADAQIGALQPYYHNRIPESLPPDVVASAQSSLQTSILASRGCELQCSFCSAQNIFGKFYLQRNLASVLRDIETIQTPYINFLDDNFYGASPKSHAFYDRILEAVKAKGISWYALARLPVLTDEVLDRFSESGCVGLFIGFESINQENTRNVGKAISPEIFLKEIEKIHSKGIGVYGSFIFGFDNDTPHTIDSTLAFCLESRMEVASFSILTPFPGTKTYRDLAAQGRILTHDWDKYNCDDVVFQPKHFTPEELYAHKMRAVTQFYALPSIFRRVKGGMNYDRKLVTMYNLFRKFSLMYS